MAHLLICSRELLLNLLIWNQHEPLGRLFIGGGIILASVWLSRLGGRAQAPLAGKA